MDCADKCMKSCIVILTTMLTVAVSTQAAAGFKCGFNSIVDNGDSKAKVIVTCGKPAYKDTVVGQGSEIIRETWTYRDYTDRHWMTSLHFTGGVLDRIESLGRVD